jgi:acyl-CoA thioesterase-1
MLIRSILLLISIALPGIAGAERVLVLGDSLSAAHNMAIEAGWVSLLGNHLTAEDCTVDVINASISGETTAGGLVRLPELMTRHQPSIVILELGGNDGLRGQPVARARENLARMIALAQDGGAQVVLAGIQIPSNYGRRYADAFAAMYPDLATAYDVALVPFLLDGIALRRDLMQDDRIHPRAEAQPRVLANVLPALEPLLPACL